MKNVELAEQWRLISQDDFEMSHIAMQKGKRLHAAFCAQQSILYPIPLSRLHENA